MNKYLRKNGKKIMAFLGVLLMIAFALPSTCGQYGGPTREQYATLQGGKVKLTNREMQNLQNQWRFLRQRVSPAALAVVLGSAGPTMNQDMLSRVLGDRAVAGQIEEIAIMARRNPWALMQDPGAQSIMRALNEGDAIMAQFEQNEDMYPLLLKEAQLNGTTVNNDTIEEILTRRGSTPDTDPDHDHLRTAYHNFLQVINCFNRAGNVVKVSQPARQHTLASRMQEMSVNLVEFNAKDFLAQVGEPSPEQIKSHFDKYKDQLAENSPSGFGYKYPNRIKFDALILDREQLKKAVGAIDLVDMYEYFERNKNKPEMILTTQPATKPSDELTLSSTPVATKPTTRPKTFAEAKEQIERTLMDQRIAELSNKVRDTLRNTLVTDYNAFKVAKAAGKGTATQPAPPSSLGVPYNSFEYLQALRNKIQKDFNVDLTIEKRDQWQSASSLKDTDFAKMSWDPDPAQMSPSVEFIRIMTNQLEPFVSEDARKQAGGGRVFALWEPTPPLNDELMAKTMIARATAADPAHAPASLDEVKDKVLADVKLALAYEKAKQSAQALANAAKSGKWLQTVGKEQNRNVITTGTFQPGPSGFLGNLPIQGYPQLKDPALTVFKTGAFKLLNLPPRTGGPSSRPVNPITPATTPTTTTKPAVATTTPATTQPLVAADFKNHPVGIVEIPTEAKVLAVEVNSLQAARGWTKENQDMVQLQLMMQQLQSEESLLRYLWFNYDDLTNRLNFKPQEGQSAPQQPRQPIPRPNPFLGHAMP